MEFTKSPYYDKKLLGKALYNRVSDMCQIYAVYDFFRINKKQKEYEKHNEGEYSYKLKVFEKYYELNCDDFIYYVFVIFDKPVHIVGKHCACIIAPEIIVENINNECAYHCVSNKLIINNNYDYDKTYNINYSKIKDIYFYNYKISFLYSEINNFYIKNENIEFDNSSCFINSHKIKVFGKSKKLKEEMLNNLKFREGIIHIE